MNNTDNPLPVTERVIFLAFFRNVIFFTKEKQLSKIYGGGQRSIAVAICHKQSPKERFIVYEYQ